MHLIREKKQEERRTKRMSDKLDRDRLEHPGPVRIILKAKRTLKRPGFERATMAGELRT